MSRHGSDWAAASIAATLDCTMAGCRCTVVLIFHSVHLVSNPSIWDLNGSEFGYFRIARDLEIHSQHARLDPPGSRSIQC